MFRRKQQSKSQLESQERRDAIIVAEQLRRTELMAEQHNELRLIREALESLLAVQHTILHPPGSVERVQ
jgi:uncharacterized protein YqeY